MNSQIIARQAVVHGLVQGVGFRWSTQNAATGMGVTGWVRNLDDGTVEVFVEGSPDRVEQMVAWLDRGPRYARVTHVEVTSVKPAGYGSFNVRG